MNLYAIYHHISYTFAHQSSIPIAFLDIEKAYDSVWLDALMYKLYNSGIKGCAYRFIKSFIYNRNFRVYSNGIYSNWFSNSAGVPQGSVFK